MIAIVDYGLGNLFSLQSSLAAIGLEGHVTGQQEEIEKASHIILPGVGAFEDAIARLQQTKLNHVMKEQAKKGKPILGVCLGMQLLFDESYEFGMHKGLGLIPGKIRALKTDLERAGFDYKVPHMGWNQITIGKKDSPIVAFTKTGEYFYYVHSYYATDCEEYIVGNSEYGIMIPGIVQNKNVFGAQFHPEKSTKSGLRLLQAFAEIK